MTQDSGEKTPEQIRKMIDEVLPGFVDFLEELGDEDASAGEFLMDIVKETTDFRERYPIISHLLMDALQVLRLHEQRIEVLKEILISSGIIIPSEDKPVDKRYIN